MTSSSIPLVQLDLQDVSYRVGDKQILQNISTTIAPHSLSAWMGPSGSGKSSLLKVTAGLAKADGCILVNGQEGHIPRRLVGVVWQDDLLLTNLTVHETVAFAARLKGLPSVEELVVETLKELGLIHVQHSLVKSVSGGERKRVAVAVEMVVRPSVLLLDEPTSGLDATTAQSLVETLKSLATKGHSVVIIVHQPRTAIYTLLDRLLLLRRGRRLYDGPADRARSFLESCPTIPSLPPETGIADWMMDVVIADESNERGLVEHWDEFGATDIPEQENRNVHHRPSLTELKKASKFETSFWTQFLIILQRTGKQQRGEKLTSTAVILQLAYLGFTALFWWRLPDNTARVFERNSLFFFFVIAQSNGVVVNAVSVFGRERTLLYRERAKKMYGVGAYFLAKTISDMSNNVLLPVAYVMIAYWTGNFRSGIVRYLQFVLTMYMTISTAQSMGLFLSICVLGSTQLALVLAPPITLFFMIMGGFYIPLQNMHPGIKWVSWFSFARYGYTALLINEYEERDVACATGEVPIQIGDADVCPLPGEDILSGLGIVGVSSSFWFNVGMVTVLQVVFRVGAYILLRKRRPN